MYESYVTKRNIFNKQEIVLLEIQLRLRTAHIFKMPGPGLDGGALVVVALVVVALSEWLWLWCF